MIRNACSAPMCVILQELEAYWGKRDTYFRVFLTASDDYENVNPGTQALATIGMSIATTIVIMTATTQTDAPKQKSAKGTIASLFNATALAVLAGVFILGIGIGLGFSSVSSSGAGKIVTDLDLSPTRTQR